MQISLDGGELSLIPESEEDRKLLRQFMEPVENHRVDADFDGVNLDELVFSPACDEN